MNEEKMKSARAFVRSKDFTEIERTACDIVLSVPLHSREPFDARVPWKLINQLRRELEAEGVDWRKHHPRNSK